LDTNIWKQKKAVIIDINRPAQILDARSPFIVPETFMMVLRTFFLLYYYWYMSYQR
jgi:hypothetical protein